MKNKMSRIFAPKHIVYDYVKLTAFLPMLLYCRTKRIFASEKAKKRIKGGAILISNHNGFFDPVCLMLAVWYRRQHFLALKQLFEGKSGWWFRHFGCIPVDKENVSMDTFREVSGCLSRDEIVTVFPEGHINDGSGRMDTFKSGVVLMAVRGRKPIIPIYVKARKHWYNRYIIVIGEPVEVASPDGKQTFSQIDSFAEKLHKIETELEALADNN